MKRNLSNEREFGENYGVPINYIPSCMRSVHMFFFLFHLTQETRGRKGILRVIASVSRQRQSEKWRTVLKEENAWPETARNVIFFSIEMLIFYVLFIVYKKKKIYIFAKFEIKLSNKLILLKKKSIHDELAPNRN